MLKDGLPALPVGQSPKFHFMRSVWFALWGGRFPFADSDTVKCEWNNGNYTFKAARGGNASIAGLNWQTPNKELDTTKSVSQNTLVYVSPKNVLVTAGMTDVISSATVISCEGIWQAAQNIPAATGGKYNVPVFPYINGATSVGGATFGPGTTVPSGTPLIGDLDLVNTTTGKPTIYWIYWGQVAC